jgi:DNA-binding IclR family transcriptional regulator
MSSTNQERSVLQSVHNGLRIIKLFTKEKTTWGIREAARELNLPKSSVNRAFQVLLQEGYLQEYGTKYRLGLSLLYLTGIIKSHMEIKRESAEPLQSLVNKFDESVLVANLEGSKVIYLLKYEKEPYLELHGDIGSHNPVHCSSSGKVLLAHKPMAMVEKIIKEGLQKMGPNSITDPSVLLSRLKKIKQEAYCIDIDEMHDNVISIAAPVKDYMGKVIAAVSLIGPKQRIKSKNVSIISEEVIKTAKEISNRLGYIEALNEE